MTNTTVNSRLSSDTRLIEPEPETLAPERRTPCLHGFARVAAATGGSAAAFENIVAWVLVAFKQWIDEHALDRNTLIYAATVPAASAAITEVIIELIKFKQAHHHSYHPFPPLLKPVEEGAYIASFPIWPAMLAGNIVMMLAQLFSTNSKNMNASAVPGIALFSTLTVFTLGMISNHFVLRDKRVRAFSQFYYYLELMVTGLGTGTSVTRLVNLAGEANPTFDAYNSSGTNIATGTVSIMSCLFILIAAALIQSKSSRMNGNAWRKGLNFANVLAFLFGSIDTITLIETSMVDALPNHTNGDILPPGIAVFNYAALLAIMAMAVYLFVEPFAKPSVADRSAPAHSTRSPQRSIHMSSSRSLLPARASKVKGGTNAITYGSVEPAGVDPDLEGGAPATQQQLLS